MKTLEFLKAWLMSMQNKGEHILNPTTIIGLVFTLIIAGSVLFGSTSTNPVSTFVNNVNSTVYPYNSSLASNLPILLILGIVFAFVLAIIGLHKKGK